jgi:hypothetical protein
LAQAAFLAAISSADPGDLAAPAVPAAISPRWRALDPSRVLEAAEAWVVQVGPGESAEDAAAVVDSREAAGRAAEALPVVPEVAADGVEAAAAVAPEAAVDEAGRRVLP